MFHVYLFLFSFLCFYLGGGGGGGGGGSLIGICFYADFILLVWFGVGFCSCWFGEGGGHTSQVIKIKFEVLKRVVRLHSDNYYLSQKSHQGI